MKAAELISKLLLKLKSFEGKAIVILIVAFFSAFMYVELANKFGLYGKVALLLVAIFIPLFVYMVVYWLCLFYVKNSLSKKAKNKIDTELSLEVIRARVLHVLVTKKIKYYILFSDKNSLIILCRKPFLLIKIVSEAPIGIKGLAGQIKSKNKIYGVVSNTPLATSIWKFISIILREEQQPPTKSI